MAVNLGITWKKNLYGRPAPFRFPISFGAGTTAIKSGEILDLSSTPAPLASDKSMAGIIAIADHERRSGDLAGYQYAIIPTPGDVFEYALASAAAPAVGASLYFSDSQTLTTSGTNVIGNVCDESILPAQGLQSVDPSYDAGTTIRTTGKVLMTFKAATSYFAALQT